MTSRQAGKHLGSVAETRKSARRGGARRAKRDEPMQRRERRQLLRLLVCGTAFVLLVAAKLALPRQMERFNSKLEELLTSNMDVQAVFSAVGRGLSGDAQSTAEEVYEAVFHDAAARETSAALWLPEENMALETLRKYQERAAEVQTGQTEAAVTEQTQQPEQPAAAETQQAEQSRTEASTLAYVLYSEENLPENVSLEQAILDFDYCTPVRGALSSPFGYREHPVEGEERFHYGVDLAADTGTAVRCFADGTVTAVGESSSYGKYCIVTHGGGYTTLYAHCSRIAASSGAEVKREEKIAEVGETGVATGPHLHFELHQNGVYLNPIYYVSPV